MKDVRQFEGVDVQTALEDAARELGIDREELDYEVVDPGAKGILGVGGRLARIVINSPKAESNPVGDAACLEIEAFTAELLERMHFHLKARVHAAEEAIEVLLNGGDRDVMLQNRAELLDVFQYLLNRIFSRRYGRRRIVVDCDGFRQRKEEELREIARRASQKVKLTGVQQQLGLLNAYERRIVHLAVADQEGVTSASEGDGLMKRITIMPSGEPAAQKRG